jgi:hypothetical protein
MCNVGNIQVKVIGAVVLNRLKLGLQIIWYISAAVLSRLKSGLQIIWYIGAAVLYEFK